MVAIYALEQLPQLIFGMLYEIQELCISALAAHYGSCRDYYEPE